VAPRSASAASAGVRPPSAARLNAWLGPYARATSSSASARNRVSSGRAGRAHPAEPRAERRHGIGGPVLHPVRPVSELQRGAAAAAAGELREGRERRREPPALTLQVRHPVEQVAVTGPQVGPRTDRVLEGALEIAAARHHAGVVQPSSRPPIGFHEFGQAEDLHQEVAPLVLVAAVLTEAAERGDADARNRPWIGSVRSRWISSWLMVVSRRVAPGLPMTKTTSPARTPSLPHPKYAGVRAGCPSGRRRGGWRSRGRSAGT